jgi:CAAX protease family protein
MSYLEVCLMSVPKIPLAEGAFMKTTTRKKIILASPVLVVTLGHFAAQLFTALLGQWAWVGVAFVYWGSLLFIIAWLGDRPRIKPWFAQPQGSRWWLFLALAIGLISFPLLFIPNIHILRSVPLLIAWFAFAVINSVCEEAYWRGFLLDEMSDLPRAFGVVYSSLLFIAIHPLMLGVFSRIQAFDPAHPLNLLPFILILVMISLVYCLVYLKTKSLRWPILSHFLSDLGNLSIFLFMNMI